MTQKYQTATIGKQYAPLRLTGYYSQVPGSTPRITAEVLSQIAGTGPVQRQLRQLSLLAFPGFEFDVIGPDGKDKEELLSTIRFLDEKIGTLALVRHSFFDRVTYGAALFEYTWQKGKDNLSGWIVPDIVQWLPARSFGYKPDTLNDEGRYIFGKVLNGIVYDVEKREYLFYQKATENDFIQIPSSQILFSRDPNTEYPDGESYISGIVPTVQQWQFVRKNTMQFMHRVGKPSMIAKILPEANTALYQLPSATGLSSGSAVSPSNRMTGVWNYLDLVVQSQGAENAFVLPPYTDLVYPDIKTAINPIEPDQYLIREIVSHLFPRDYLESIGKSLNSAGNPLLLLLNMMVAGHRELSANLFESYWTNFARINGFNEHKVYFKWWNLLPKDESAELNRIVSATQSDIMLIDEARKELGYPALTAETRKLLYEEILAKKARPSNMDTRQTRRPIFDEEGQYQNMAVWDDVSTPKSVDDEMMEELMTVPELAVSELVKYGVLRNRRR